MYNWNNRNILIDDTLFTLDSFFLGYKSIWFGLGKVVLGLKKVLQQAVISFGE